jgi:glycerophosphoryl diester phosphodiesterase/membrane-associated phospholipid phosphatase
MTATAAILFGLVAIASLSRTTPLEPHPHFAEHRPANIAHAGAQGHAPGNTLEAFEIALEMGADTLEMDLQITADDEIVAHHDGTVDRQTDGSGAVREMTLAELKELDAGYTWVDDQGSTPWRGEGTQIPTLEEIFEAFPDTFMVLEMKTDGGDAIVEALADRLRAYGREDNVIVASFSLDYVHQFRELMPGVPTNMPEDELRRMLILQRTGLYRWWRPPGEYAQVPRFHNDMHVTTPQLIRAADRLGIDVHVWTVNDPVVMRSLLEKGVHGIITDYPDRMAEVIAELGEPAPPPSRIHEIGLELTRWAQETMGFLTPVMELVTFIGDEEFYLFIFPLVLWSVSFTLGIHLGLMLLLSAAVNGILKLAFATPRPFFFDPEIGAVHEASFGIPSGHAQNATAVWGLAAHELKHRWGIGWAWPAAIVLIALIGWSRIHLGVHFAEDIVVGVLVGAILLVLYVSWRPSVTGWLVRQSKVGQIGAAFGVSLALIAFGLLVQLGVADFTPPASWVGADAEALEGATGVAGVVNVAAALFGLAAGLVLLALPSGFTTDGPVWQRIARYPVGVVGVAVIFLGLSAAFPGGDDPIALVLRYVRYGLVGFWIGGVAPWLFVKTRLSAPTNVDTRPEDASTT